MKFNKAKCKDLNLGHRNPKHTYKLDREWIGRSLGKKDLGMLVDEMLIVTWQHALKAQKAKHILGCRQSSVGSRQREGILPLCSDLMRPTYSAASSPGVLNIKRQFPV